MRVFNEKLTGTNLGEREREVLRVVWSLKQATALQVRRALQRSLKDSTVRTILSRLESKGYLAHDKIRRAFLYRSAHTPEHLAAFAVKRVADLFCNGSVEVVLTSVLEANILSERDVGRVMMNLKSGKRGVTESRWKIR
jgi:BlaI family penicillinase repressor